MDSSLIAGRDFTSQDGADARWVVIVNDAMARLFWPHNNPLGERFEIGDNQRRTVEIIGIVQNTKHRMLDEESRPVMYVPVHQQYVAQMVLYVRRDEPLTMD